MSRAEALLNRNITPVIDHQKEIWGSNIGYIIQQCCNRIWQADIQQNRPLETDVFRLSVNGNLCVFRVPTLQHFLKHTRFRCIKILEEDILVRAHMHCFEATEKPSLVQELHVLQQWPESYFTVERNPVIQHRLYTYFQSHE